MLGISYDPLYASAFIKGQNKMYSLSSISYYIISINAFDFTILLP